VKDQIFFGPNLRKLRRSRRMTQADLAHRLFVSVQAISKWERGESLPDVSHVCALTRIFNVSADVLLGITAEAEMALLAVDGGGTKTEMVLIRPDGHLLKRLVLPGSNPNSVSRETCIEILCQGINQMQQTKIRLLGIYVGGSGLGSGNHGAAVMAALQERYPGIPLKCETDICNVLACAEDPDNAIAVISGTGSVVFATARGKLLRAGGGGWKLDPVGSGYEIGRRALLAALEDRDQSGPSTALTKLVEQKLGDTVWNSIPFIYSSESAEIAAFTPLVIDAWQSGDAVAGRIVEENGQRLAKLVQSAFEKSPLARQVLLSGSLLLKSEPFRRLVTQLLPGELVVSEFRAPPVWGACLRCATLCCLPKPDYETFIKQYEQEETL